jgi:hypothetical protein
MNSIVKQHNLKPADRIIVPKRGFEIVQHHAIYLGQNRYGEDLIAENTIDHGVRIISATEFFKDITRIVRIEKFLGNDFQRRQAVQDAILLKGTKYDLLDFNCEHYASYVQTKIPESKQINNGAKILGFIALLFGVTYLVTD